jgi:iron complex outermembrane recepter protein
VKPIFGESHSFRTFFLAALAGTTALSSCPALAAAADGAAAETTAADNAKADDEIVVLGSAPELFRARNASSVSRFDLAIEKTPQAVSVITEDLLKAANIQTLEDATYFVPGLVTLGLNGWGEPRSSFKARGVNINLTNSFKLDNYSFAFQGILDMVGVERIEFVKGPSAIGYGQASYGGMINLVTKKPLKEAYYSASANVESYNRYGFEADLTGPITEDGRVRFRLGVGYRAGDGFRTGETSNILTAVPVLAIDLTEKTELSFTGYYQQAGNTLGGSIPILEDAAGNRIIPNKKLISRKTFLGNSDRNHSDNEIRSLVTKIAHEFDDTTKATAVLTYSKSKLDVVTAYSAPFAPTSIDPASGDYGLIPSYTQSLYDNNRYINAELSVQKDFEAFGQEHSIFVLGGHQNYERELGFAGSCNPAVNIFDFATSDFLPTFPTTEEADNQTGNFCYGLGIHQKEKNSNIGVQGNFVLTDKISLLLGIRYDSLNRYYLQSDHGLSQSVIRRDGAVLVDNTSSEISTRAGLVYAVTPQVNTYVTYVTGFTPQLGVTRNGGIVNNEVGKLYEVGAKGTFNNGALGVNTALFILKTDSSSIRDPANKPGEEFVIAGGANKRWGGEIEVVGAVNANISVSANYAYVNGEVTKSPGTPARVGQDLPVGARHKASAFVNYTFDKDGALHGLNLNAAVSYTGSQYGRFGPTVGVKVPSFTLVDIGGSYALTEKMQVSLNVRNLLDKDYVLPSADAFGVNYGEPRTYAVTLRIVM